MAEINILFGFEASAFQRSVVKRLKDLGYNANIVNKYSKAAVADFLRKNRAFDHVVLRETMGKNAYSDAELAELTDVRDINVIVVLSERHKGTSYMETLYAANITGALFQTGNHSDASPQKVVELILHKRRRDEARKYYGILDKTSIKLDKLSDGKLNDLLHSLDDASFGRSMAERFLQLCTTLSVAQCVEFIQKMPIDTRSALEKSDEYWVVIKNLQDHGVEIKSKKYNQGVRNLSKRGRVQGNRDSVRIEDKKLDEEYVPAAQKQEERLNSKRSVDSYIQPQDEDEYEDEEYADDEPEYAELRPAEPEEKPLPPTDDWRELKRREKERKKAERRKGREKKKKPVREKPSVNKVPTKKAPNKKQNSNAAQLKKDFLIRIVIVFAIIALVCLLIAVIMGVNYMTRKNALNEAQEEAVLTEQMYDLAEIRSGERYDVSAVVPVTDAVLNGSQLMGLNVMDVINTNTVLFYVCNLDGSIYTFENGGATSAEIDINSMYNAQLLTSGRFVFYQQ